MQRGIIPNVNEADTELMELLLKKGHIKHKYAVRIQTVLNRASGMPTREVASQLHINEGSVSSFVHRYMFPASQTFRL